MKLGLIGFPLFMMFILIIISTGASTAQGAPVNFAGGDANSNLNSPLVQFSCASTPVPSVSPGPCFPSQTLPTSAQITCASGAPTNTCDLFSGCASPSYPGTSCVYTAFVFPFYTQMDAGTTITISPTGTASSSKTAGAFFVFSNIGPAGFLVMITIAVGVAVLAGISVFGSGENQESVHILFMGGLLLGLWAILTAAEGFPSGNSSSFFVSLNSGIAGLGTTAYVALSLVYVLGIIGTVSRGQ